MKHGTIMRLLSIAIIIAYTVVLIGIGYLMMKLGGLV